MKARLLRLLHGDRGAGSTLFFAVLIPAVLIAALGLTLDGSSKMDATRRATLVAGEAARAAGQALDSAAIEGMDADVDVTKAADAASSYLAAAGVDGTVSVSGKTVTVTVSIPWQPKYVPVGGAIITETRSSETVRT